MIHPSFFVIEPLLDGHRRLAASLVCPNLRSAIHPGAIFAAIKLFSPAASVIHPQQKIFLPASSILRQSMIRYTVRSFAIFLEPIPPFLSESGSRRHDLSMIID
jgi:hypothetical protein